MIRSKLKEIIDQRGESIRSVSKSIDYRFETVRQMYNNEMKHYPNDLLDKLCAYLKIGIGDLLEHIKDENTQE